jgi:DNA-directed RNA polymerase subunit beta'
VDVPLRDIIIGRTCLHHIVNRITDAKIVAANELVTPQVALKIEALGIDSVQVRSALTCETARGICALCYGTDMSTGLLAEEGLAVGTIAAQSIGEPGTQLTMRTFHTGGIAARGLVENNYRANYAGTVEVRECNEVEVAAEGGSFLTVLKRNGDIAVLDDKGRELEKYKVPYGATLKVTNGTKVRKAQVLVEWDPHRIPILAEKTGVVRFKDIEIGETVREEASKQGRASELMVIEHTGEKHPQIIIEDENGKLLDFHHLPAKARIEVTQGQRIAHEPNDGQMLARWPKEVAGSAHIVGGLPRVTEVFEARTPKDPAVMAEISGKVELYHDKRKGADHDPRDLRLRPGDRPPRPPGQAPPGPHRRLHHRR